MNPLNWFLSINKLNLSTYQFNHPIEDDLIIIIIGDNRSRIEKIKSQVGISGGEFVYFFKNIEDYLHKKLVLWRRIIVYSKNLNKYNFQSLQFWNYCTFDKKWYNIGILSSNQSIELIFIHQSIKLIN